MRIRDAVVAVLMVIVFLAVSLPYRVQFEYWAESSVAWVVYFVVGGIACIYIAYSFLRSLRSVSGEAEEKETHG